MDQVDALMAPLKISVGLPKIELMLLSLFEFICQDVE